LVRETDPALRPALESAKEAAIRALHARYAAWFGDEPAGVGACAAIEQALALVLPLDLRRIASFYRGGLLGGFSLHEIGDQGSADNIVAETRRLRASAGLPHEFLVLAEPPESLIVLRTMADAAADTPVIWCSAVDVARLAGMQVVADPNAHPSNSSE
jgi:hypothetical protein